MTLLGLFAAMAQPLAADAPATPTGLETEPGNGQVTLTWEDPGDPTIKYIYRVQEGGGVVGSWKDIPGSDILGSNAGTISYVVPDLTNGSAYRFHLRAENDDGQSGIASSLWEYAISDAPAPTGFTVTVGWVSGEATLTWDDPGDDDPDDEITGYQYSAVAPGYNSGWTEIPNSANTFSVTLTGLTDEYNHFFRVRAVNNQGPGAFTDPAVSGIPSPPRPPGPTGFTAIPGDGQVALSWDYSADPRIDGYGYGQIAGNTWIYYAIEGSDRSTTSHTVTGLTNDNAYWFHIRAFNITDGNQHLGMTSVLQVVTPRAVPGPPRNVAAAPGDGSVTLTWDPPASSGGIEITGYEFEIDGSGRGWEPIPDAGTARSHTVTDLTNGQAYTLRVRARNASGPGAAGAEVSVTPVAQEKPATPTGFSTTAGNGQVTLTWDDPGSGANITNYKYRKRAEGEQFGTDGNTWVDIGIPGSNAGTISYAVTGLTNGIAYQFELRAKNDDGESGSAELKWEFPISDAPAPTGFTVTVGWVSGEATLTWDDPQDVTITGYQYSAVAPGYNSGWTEIPNSANTFSVTLTGLTDQDSHQFKVRAVNADGPGASSDPAGGVPSPPRPPAPSGFTAIPGDGQVALSWDYSDDRRITGYEYGVYSYRTGGAWTYSSIEGSDRSTTNHTVTGLTNDNRYLLKIRAFNITDGNQYPGEASVGQEVTPRAVPSSPRNVAAAPGDGSVTLTWDPPASSGGIEITGYEFEIDGSGRGWEPIPGADAARSHTVTDLTNGQAYTLRVRARNASGPGAAGAEVSVTPVAQEKPATPTGFSTTAGNGQVTLTWDDPGSGANITNYKYRKRAEGEQFGTDGNTWVDIGIPGSNAGTISYAVTGLTNGIAYQFELRAKNDDGESGSAELKWEFPISDAPAPTGFTVTVGWVSGEATLTWDDPQDVTITGYQYSAVAPGYNSGWTEIPNSANTFSVTLTGLTDQDSHQFKVRAVNADGPGASSDPAGGVPSPPRPPAPSGFTAIPGDGQVALSWDYSDDRRITGYEYGVYSYRTGGAWTYSSIEGSDRSTTNHTVTGLTNDNRYLLKIRAFNITDGNQYPGEASVGQEVTPRAVPSSPRNVAAAPGDGSVTLTWDPPASSGGIEITGYEFEIDGSGRGWEPIPGADAARSHTVTDLTNGQSYTLRVRARNASGPGAAGAEVSVTPVAPPKVLMVNFQSSTYHVREGQGITVTVTLSPAADRTLGVPVTVTVGTAEAGDWDVSGLTDGGLGFADGDEFKRFTVSANQDGDEDGETVTLAFGALPANVSAGANPSATVTITDDDGANKQPVAENDSAATEEDTPVAVDVLANDSDPNGDALIITQSTESTAGGSTEIESGKITYSPKADFHGEDSFSYTVSDQSGAENETATATVSLTVTPLNDPPEPVGAIPRQQLGVGGDVAEIDVAAYFRDRDGDVLTYTAVSSSPEIAQVAVAASTVTITPVGAGAATITVTAHDRPMDDPERLTAQQTISMRLVAASVVMRINRVNQTVLPEVLRAMSASGLGAVTGRIEQAVSGALPAGGFNLAGQSSLYQALQANARAIEDGTLDLERALADLSFVMPLNAAETGGRGAPGSLTLWGTGDYRNLSGGKDGAVEWNGEVLSVHLGSDARLREDLVAGLLVSWSRSAFDYTDHTDPEGISGTQESRLTSLNPYVGWKTPIGMSLWGTLGVGWGEVEIDDEEADPVSSGMTRRLAAAGASGTVFSSTDLIAGGTTRLTLRGQGSFARLEVEGAGLIEPLIVDVYRVRLALESSHARKLAAGGTVIPAVELGLRHDGGGGETGGGVELGGSLRYQNPASGLTMEARGWTLIVHGANYEEWGISGLLRLDPGAASRGISLSMVPAWGETQSGVQRLWENSTTRMADGGAGATTMLPARLEATLGYGFGVLASRGVLTPYSGVSLSGNGSRRFSLGSRLEIGSSLNLSLEGARHSTAAKQEPDYGVMLRGQVRF